MSSKIMISAIIPAYNEPYLQRTIDNLLDSAGGDIEIITVLDGYWPDPTIKDHPKVTLIHNGKSCGMRSAINSAARIAKGEYLLKCDAHCAFDKDFDTKLKADCEHNYTVVPVRYSLDPVKWQRKPDKKYEFEYIASGDLKGKRWPEYASRVNGQKIVDLMTFQGSCWFMHKEFFEKIGGLDDVNYGGMGREAQEICLKTWLIGGRCVLNRNTWYAHWSKSKKDIKHSNRKEKLKSVEYATDIWLNDKWPPATRNLQWLIDRFSPVPTWETNMAKEEKLWGSIVKKVGMTRSGLYRYFAELGFKTGCEVGVQRGRNAKIMFDNISGLELFLVDAYADHPSNRRKWGEKAHRKFKRMAKKRLESNNVHWLEGFSENVVHEVPDGLLDFVYIDGEHTYDFVMLDIILWSRKVRRGGIISGHDFEFRDRKLKNNAKVAEAVTDYTGRYRISPVYITDKSVNELPGDKNPSWYFFKR